MSSKTLRNCIWVTTALLATGALAGCGSLSHHIAKDGTSAGQLVWPQAAATNPLKKGGTFPTLDSVRLVQSGQSKNQIMALIGSPHFGEGFAGVREWNYLFNLHGADGAVTQCEFKILFDAGQTARSFYWNPASCADIVNPPPPPPPPKPTPTAFTLSADALFAFDKSSLADMSAKGKAELDDVAAKLNAPDVKTNHVHVVGYTDRIGSDAYNQKLSESRAGTVRDYLVGKGVSADRIDAEGKGEADPIKSCDDTVRAKLIACLAPNRRVTVEVDATH